jgi:hypothetical protein
MHQHRTQPLPRNRLAEPARLLWFHRRHLAAATAITVVIVGLVCATPWLLSIALLERHQTPRRKQLLGLIILTTLAQAAVWFWGEVRRHPFEPRGPWHACQRCGYPIPNRSRARYCSAGCRRRGRLELLARTDDRAAARLARLDQPAPSYDPATAEIPF